jgi:DNA-binding CsgD family transcriptional regulator
MSAADHAQFMSPANPLPARTASLSWDPASSRTLADAIAATGTDGFGTRLLSHLHEACGADHCAVFRLGRAAPSELVTGSHDGSGTAHTRVCAYLDRRLWSEDPAMVYAHAKLVPDELLLMRVDVANLGDPVAREVVWPRIQDRLVVAGRSRSTAYSMSILREGRSRFSTAELARLGASAGVLVAMLAKHADLVAQQDASGVLGSLEAIETCLSELSALRRREVEVCARILHGLSTPGIALDLGVGTETVKTFRKLAYRRLGIGSERELLSFYLGLQQRWQALQAGRG